MWHVCEAYQMIFLHTYKHTSMRLICVKLTHTLAFLPTPENTCRNEGYMFGNCDYTKEEMDRWIKKYLHNPEYYTFITKDMNQ